MKMNKQKTFPRHGHNQQLWAIANNDYRPSGSCDTLSHEQGKHQIPRKTEEITMKNNIADVTDEREPLRNYPQALMQVRNVQTRIKEQTAKGRTPQRGLPSWVEVGPEGVRVSVLRWIE